MRDFFRAWFWVCAAVMTGHTLGAIVGLWTPDMTLVLMALVGVATLLWLGWAGEEPSYGATARESAFRAALRTWCRRIGGS